MEPIIDHIEITVKDMSVAVPFYDKLLPLLGFDLKSRNSAVLDDHELHVVEYLHPRLGFAINSPRSAFRDDAVHRRRPGALHHLAFRAKSRAEVHRLHVELKRIGAAIVIPPREFPEYVPPGYYALFFKESRGHQVRDRPHPGAAEVGPSPAGRSRRDSVLQAADQIALDITRQVRFLERPTLQLGRARDLLLPRLMNGELKP